MDQPTRAVMATYPARRPGLERALASIASQVDEVTLVANEYTKRNFDLQVPKNVRVLFPRRDTKDVGKFILTFDADDFVFLCDDDILYPGDYVQELLKAYRKYEPLQPIVGLHGVIYSDFFEGRATSRIVFVFTEGLEHDAFVNQLGSGALLCRGRQLPDLAFMEGSAKFVDLRFAVHCQRRGFPRIAVARQPGWLREIEAETSLFETFTRHWPAAVTREAHEIAGLRHLPRGSPSEIMGASAAVDS